MLNGAIVLFILGLVSIRECTECGWTRLDPGPNYNT